MAGKDLEKFIERYPTYIEALEILEQKDKRIAELEKQLDQANERLKGAIVPRFKYGDCVYVVYTNTDIFKGQIDLFDYYSHKYFVFFNEDIGSDWFFENRLFSTKKEAQEKLKELQNG